MEAFLTILIWAAGIALGVQAFVGLSFFISSIHEKEPRAAFWGFLQFLGMLGLFVLFLVPAAYGFFDSGFGMVILLLVCLFGAIAAVAAMRRTEDNPLALKGAMGYVVGEAKKIDERDQVFARNRALRPGSKEYQAYYADHPEKEALDAERRARGGPIGIPGTIDKPYAEADVAMLMGSLAMPHHLSAPEMVKPKPHPLIAEKRKDNRVELSPEEASVRVKGYVKNIGADLVGIAEISPLWVYSHRGEIFRDNWEDWGKEIELSHKYAIVFAEEMSLDLIGPAPHTPTLIESMNNYAKGAYVSTQLAAFIANMGYSATANHLRHYEVILPPLAADAGLGEIGRLGYLLTKEFGPRVRLSAVTTDLPLVCDKPVDIGVQDFCRICKKCGVCCPSRSIPLDETPGEHNGCLKWKLDDESCFNYWGKVGTDCNVCMKVCPWGHARTFPHRLIVWLISRNWITRRIFSILDDIFYGRKPKPKVAPQWASFKRPE
jgi:reductive dehalogenase